jgi:hypothetical protein
MYRLLTRPAESLRDAAALALLTSAMTVTVVRLMLSDRLLHHGPRRRQRRRES